MNNRNIFSNVKVLSLFSLFSISTFFIIVIVIGLMIAIFTGFIDPNTRIVHMANEFIEHETGIPVKELEEVEGVKKLPEFVTPPVSL